MSSQTQAPERDGGDAGYDADLWADPFHMLRIVWGRRMLLLSLMVCATMGMLSYGVVIATPTYQASATVILESRKNSVARLGAVVEDLSRDEEVVNSEVEVMRSRRLLFEVVDALSLDRLPEFNPALRVPSFAGVVGRQLQLRMSGRAEGPPVSQSGPPDTDQARLQAVELLTRAVRVEAVPSSLVFRVAVVTSDPQLSARIANTICRIYVEDQLNAKLAASREAQEWLYGRVLDLQGALMGAEERLSRFSAGTELISPEALRGLSRQAKEQRDLIVDARAALTEARQKGGAALVRAQARLSALEAALFDLDARIKAQSTDLISQRQLEREAEASADVYAHFLNRYKETAAQEGFQRPDSKLLSAAVVPTRRHAPKLIRLVAFGQSMALLAGVIWVLLSEIRNTRIRTPEALQRFLGAPVLAVLPSRPGGTTAWESHVLAPAFSSYATAVRGLRTRLLQGAQDAQVIAFVAAENGTVKTLVAGALARQLAQLGRRVLLIETDFHARGDGFDPGVAESDGLYPLLETGGAPDHLIHPTAHSGFDVLGAGRPERPTADVLASPAWGALLDGLRARYDHIVIDTAPALALPDAGIAAGLADIAVLVVEWNQTETEALRQMVNTLGTAAGRVVGSVLSGVDPRGLRRSGLGKGAMARYGVGSHYYSD